MDKKETNLKKKNNKFLLKNCMTNNFIWKYIYVSLCTYFYVDPTISSKAKIRKTISMLRLTQKNTVLIEKRVKHFLLNEHIKIFWYERTLTNKYCKTGIRERTLLKSRFVKPCMHVMFDENSFIDAACTVKLQVLNPSYLKKLRGC